MQSYYKQHRYGNLATNQATLYSIRAVSGNTSMGRVSVSGDKVTIGSASEKVTGFTGQTATLQGYPHGTPVHIVAAPNPGYRFVRWNGLPPAAKWQSVATQSSLSFDAQCNIDITAEFAAEQRPPQTVHTVRATVNNPSAGRVQPEQQTVNAGNSVTLSATPFDGYRFVRWDGVGTLAGNMQTNASRTITITPRADVSAVAVFEAEGPAPGITDPVRPILDEVPYSPETPITGPDPSPSPSASPSAGTAKGGGITAMLKKYWWIIAAIAVVWYCNRRK